MMGQFKILQLEGECNRCGLCCTASHRGETLYCHNLQRVAQVGMPNATFCKAYALRRPGMRILMLDKFGIIKAEGACTHGSAVDNENIAQWIGKGCSLQISRRQP